MKFWYKNLARVLSSWPSMIIWLLFWGGFRLLMEHFSDRALIAGNYGPTYALINRIFDIGWTALITIFTASIVYKIITFRNIRETNKRWALGWFFAALVGWCAACSITLAVYLGLGTLLAVMPYGGLEIKILGILVLARSARQNIRDLMVCKSHRPKTTQ